MVDKYKIIFLIKPSGLFLHIGLDSIKSRCYENFIFKCVYRYFC